MRRNPWVLLREVNQSQYLIPYGQGIVDGMRAIKINETGRLIWNLLGEGDYSLNQIIEACGRYYEMSDEELPQLTADLQPFLETLCQKRMLLEDRAGEEEKSQQENRTSHVLKIAKLRIGIQGDSSIFGKNLLDFEDREEGPIDMEVRLLQGEMPEEEEKDKLGKLRLVDDPILKIDQRVSDFLVTFTANLQLHSLKLSQDGRYADFYYRGQAGSQVTSEFFFALCHAFLYRAIQEDYLMLHSASLLYKDKAWLFSGPSGMGKSTHTALWKEAFATPMINGDLNLLGREEDRVMVYGTPWCGTSGLYDTKAYPLGGIILLQKDQRDWVEELAMDQKIMQVHPRLISPNWTQSLFDKTLTLTEAFIKDILVCKLHCTKEVHAAYTMKERIDA